MNRALHAKHYQILSQKTQVFSPSANTMMKLSDRMTHTQEVVSIARDIARRLGLNEDLVEAIALLHDTGHAPFAHEGDLGLHLAMQEYGSVFEHNAQSHWIASRLERRTKKYAGLNLRGEVLEALKAHVPRDGAAQVLQCGAIVEAQVVDGADSIAYTARDIEDGIRVGILDSKKLCEFELFARAAELAEQYGRSPRSALITILVNDMVQALQTQLRGMDLERIYAHNERLDMHTKKTGAQFADLQAYMNVTMYRPLEKTPMVNAVTDIIRTLFDYLMKHPSGDVMTNMKISAQENVPNPLLHGVRDTIVGMTDAIALRTAELIGVPEKTRNQAMSLYTTVS